jgi:catechol 2,3-dioxygenase-like lactoylglutathione lyase family enzyme
MSTAKKKGAKKKGAKKATKKRAARPAKKSAKKAAKARPAKKKGPSLAPRRDPETLRLRGISPGLTVANLQKSVAWYRDVLGFFVGEEWKRDGVVTGVELLAGTAAVFLGQDDWAKGRDRKKGEGFRLHFTTGQDVDKIAARAKAAGGVLESEPADMPWGTRAFAIVDPDGFKLTIST